MAGIALAFQDVARRFGGTTGVDGVSFDLAAGEIVAILGPSGCGKTTLLRLAAGFERPDQGEVRLGGTVVSGNGIFVAPERRGVAVVFQGFALWPHFDVAANVGYPLVTRRIRGSALREQVGVALAAVGLAGFEARAVGSLSGGQRQRVALARAMVMAPGLVLLDEPMASLDAGLRGQLLDEIAALRTRTGAGMVYVTHDQGEALALADRVAVMRAGRLEQLATPETLYEEPANAFVAEFVGGAALVRARYLGGGMAELHGARIAVRAAAQAQGEVTLAVRQAAVAPEGLDAVVRTARYVGGAWEAACALAAEPDVRLTVRVQTRIAPGEALRIGIRDAWVLPA